MAKKNDGGTTWAGVAKIWVIGGLALSAVATAAMIGLSIFAASRARDFEGSDEGSGDGGFDLKGMKAKIRGD